jgi:hypothetical protein
LGGQDLHLYLLVTLWLLVEALVERLLEVVVVLVDIKQVQLR